MGNLNYILKPNLIAAARHNSGLLGKTKNPITTTTSPTTTTRSHLAGNICDDPTFDAVTITPLHDILAFKGI